MLVSVFDGKVGHPPILLDLGKQAGVSCSNTSCPVLTPGDHYTVVTVFAPCLVGFTVDFAADASHSLKAKQIVVLLVKE